MKTASDWHKASTALRAARTAAGFHTASSAAAHFNWPEASYRAHESGTRIPSEETLGKYAQAFHIGKAQLLNPDWSRVDRQFKDAKKPLLRARTELARRLRAARVLSGLSTAVGAAKHLGVVKQTYSKHEAGENGIKPATLAFYAQSFGIAVDWLRTGVPPSGLGHRLDENMAAVLKHPESFIRVRRTKPINTLNDQDVISLPPGRPLTRVKIPEYNWSDLQNNFGDIKAMKPIGLCEFSSAGAAGPPKLFAVIVDIKHRQYKMNSRVFVYPTSYVARNNEYMVGSGSRLAVVIIDANQSNALQSDVIIGRVVGKLEPLFDDGVD